MAEETSIAATVLFEPVAGGQCVTVRDADGEMLVGFIAGKNSAGAMTATAAVGRKLRALLAEKLAGPESPARSADPAAALEAIAKFETETLARVKTALRAKNAGAATREAAAAAIAALDDARRALQTIAPPPRAAAAKAAAPKLVQGGLFD